MNKEKKSIVKKKLSNRFEIKSIYDKNCSYY